MNIIVERGQNANFLEKYITLWNVKGKLHTELPKSDETLTAERYDHVLAGSQKVIPRHNNAPLADEPLNYNDGGIGIHINLVQSD